MYALTLTQPWATLVAVGAKHIETRSWLLADVRRLAEPVPCRGHERLWAVPAEVEAQVEAQLGEEAREL